MFRFDMKPKFHFIIIIKHSIQFLDYGIVKLERIWPQSNVIHRFVHQTSVTRALKPLTVRIVQINKSPTW